MATVVWVQLQECTENILTFESCAMWKFLEADHVNETMEMIKVGKWWMEVRKAQSPIRLPAKYFHRLCTNPMSSIMCCGVASAKCQPILHSSVLNLVISRDGVLTGAGSICECGLWHCRITMWGHASRSCDVYIWNVDRHFVIQVDNVPCARVPFG